MKHLDLDTLLRMDPDGRGPRPVFLDAGDVDRVLKLTLALAQELAVARQRLDTLERQLLAQGTVTASALDPAALATDTATAQAEWQKEFLQRLLRTLEP